MSNWSKLGLNKMQVCVSTTTMQKSFCLGFNPMWMCLPQQHSSDMPSKPYLGSDKMRLRLFSSDYLSIKSILGSKFMQLQMQIQRELPVASGLEQYYMQVSMPSLSRNYLPMQQLCSLSCRLRQGQQLQLLMQASYSVPSSTMLQWMGLELYLLQMYLWWSWIISRK